MFAVNFFTANTGFANGGALGVGNNPGGETPVLFDHPAPVDLAEQRAGLRHDAAAAVRRVRRQPGSEAAVRRELQRQRRAAARADPPSRRSDTSARAAIASALMRDINAPHAERGRLSQARRPFDALYPDLAAINQLRAIGRSKYNSLQMSLIQSAWHGLSGRLNYTLRPRDGQRVGGAEHAADGSRNIDSRLGQRGVRHPPRDVRRASPTTCRRSAAAGSATAGSST